MWDFLQDHEEDELKTTIVRTTHNLSAEDKW